MKGLAMWRRQKAQRANIPPEIRRELERYGELAVQAGLVSAFDVPTSPMYSFRHEHREHVLAWLAEKRQVAHQKESHQHRWTAVAAVAGVIAAIASGIAAWPVIKEWLAP